MSDEIHVKLSQDVINEIEQKTGLSLGDLSGTNLKLAEENEIVILPALDDEGKRYDQAPTECSNVGNNKWQGQSGCANFITSC